MCFFPFVVTATLFAIIYRVVPPECMPWRHVAFGAAVTALLFTAGKAAIAAYIGSVSIGSPYGAAGSLFAFLIWLYYSSQVFFIGAIITRSRTRVDRIGEARRNDSELTGSILGLRSAERIPPMDSDASFSCTLLRFFQGWEDSRSSLVLSGPDKSYAGELREGGSVVLTELKPRRESSSASRSVCSCSKEVYCVLRKAVE
jgi:Virulence factor BrkB